MKKPSASISKLTFSSGQEFQFNSNDKVIIVGANNSGKSQSLRDILKIANEGDQARPLVIASLDIDKFGSSADLRGFLEENGSIHDGSFRCGSWQIHQSLISLWDRPYLQNSITPGFIKNIDANNRLNICQIQDSISPDEPKTKPQHILYDDDNLMQKISGIFRQAFGQDIMFDHKGGSTIPIHVGKLPSVDILDRLSDNFKVAVRANPRLDQQGDGMKGYAGIIFEAIVSALDITLIDEPEAFLHPPQMRRLGETLATEVSGQLFVATHSSDILRGFLEGSKGVLRILRLRREGTKNVVFETAPEIIRELWTRPELRYSNALDSIFHEQAIICEDDSDCRLFNAMADHLSLDNEAMRVDTAYIPTGGKHGICKIAGVLRKIGVPIKAVFDMDFLSEPKLTQDTVRAFGGNWDDFETLWKRLNAAITSGLKPKSAEEIKKEIMSIISSSNDDDLPSSQIKEALQQTAPWNIVKKTGAYRIPNGDAQKTYDALKEKLEAIGIYLVPVGEVENFCKVVGSHGTKFVTKLLTEIPLGDSRLTALRDFTGRLLAGPHAPLSSGVADQTDTEESEYPTT